MRAAQPLPMLSPPPTHAVGDEGPCQVILGTVLGNSVKWAVCFAVASPAICVLFLQTVLNPDG